MSDGRQTFTGSDGQEYRRPRKKNAALPDRYQQLVDGVISVEDLDEEELFRGQLRTVDGKFRKPPRAIPFIMHKAYVDQVTKNLERTIIQSMPDIVQGLIDIATGGINDDTGIAMDVRVKAQTYLMDRIMGRPTERRELDVQMHAKWEQAFQGNALLVDLPDDDDSDIIDADLVEAAEHPSPALPQQTTRALVERPSPSPADGREDETGMATPSRSRPPTGVKLR